MLNMPAEYASSCQSSKKSTPNWRLSYSKTWCCWWCAVLQALQALYRFSCVLKPDVSCSSSLTTMYIKRKIDKRNPGTENPVFETESQGLYSNSDLSLVSCTTPLALYPCMQAFTCFSMLHGEKSGKAWLIWWCNADVLDTVLDAIWNLRPLSHALISARVHHATCTCLCPKKWIIAKENKWRVVPKLSTI